MNIGGLLSSPYQTQIASHRQQRQAEFQQLGQDLQSGDLSAAQNHFATLTSLLSGSKAANTASTKDILSQNFQRLGQDLQSGNLSAAQQDFSQIQQDARNTRAVHGHPHRGTTECIASSSANRGVLSRLINVASTAASAYGTGGLTGLSTAGSLISTLV